MNRLGLILASIGIVLSFTPFFLIGILLYRDGRRH
jgi:uncharacterized membrane protein YdjX (TVP38/TMEM64 family)